MEQVATRPLTARFFTHWLPVLAYISVIFVLSAQPNLKPPITFTNSDKFYHTLEYLGLGVLLQRAVRDAVFPRGLLFAAGVAWLVGASIGASDEFFQSFIPGRDSSVFDWLADAKGVALAQLIVLWFANEEGH
jgi:VanZ family protein